MIRRFVILLGVSTLLLALGACDRRETVVIDPAQRVENPGNLKLPADGKEPAGSVYRFGFDLRASPQEDARQYLPFLAYLREGTGLDFELDFTPAGVEVGDRLARGEVHFAAMGAVSYILADERYGAEILARGLNSQGRATYRSKIVVVPESPIDKLSQLRGRSFAFGSASSTQGHLVPRVALLAHGITMDRLDSHRFTGSHRNCADAVIAGEADSCGMQDTLADLLVEEGKLRVLFVSDPIPSSGIVANPKVPKEAMESVRRALLHFRPSGQHSDGLYHWARTEMPLGFQAASRGDYDRLRAWMGKIRFRELLQENRGNGKP